EILLRIFSQTLLNELKKTYKLIQLNDTNNYTVYIQITSALGQTSMRAFSQTIDSIYSLVSNFCNNEQINFARNQRAIDFPSIAQHVKALIYSRMAVNLNSEQTLKKLFYICSWIAYVDYQTGRHIQSAEIINNIIKFIDLNVKVKNQILDNYYLLRIVNAKNYLRLQEYKRSLEELNFIIGNCSPQEIRAVAYCYRAKLYVETEQFELAKKDFESSFQLKKLNQDSGKPVNKRPLDFYDGLIIVNYGDYLIEIGQYHLAKKVFLHGRKLFLDCSSKYGYNDSDKRHTYVSSCDYKLGRAERILLNFNEAIVYFKRVIQDASSSLQQGTQLRRIAICKLELAKIKNVTDKGSFVTQSYDKLERFSCFIGNESRIMIERNLHLALSYIDRYMIKEAQRELFRTHQKFQTLALNRIPASELTDITAVDKNKLITEIFNKDTPYIRYHHSLLSRIMHYLGITFYKQGFLRNALICFREGMLINVARLKNVYPETSGVELLELQDTTVQQAFKVLINHPRTLMSLAEIGAIYYDLGRFDEAKAIFRVIASNQKNDNGSLIRLARSQITLGETVPASESLRSVARYQFDSFESISLKILEAECSFALSNYEEAEKQIYDASIFQTELEKKYNFTNKHVNRVRIQRLMAELHRIYGRSDEAIKACQFCKDLLNQIYPHYFEIIIDTVYVYMGLAEAYLDKNEIFQAEECIILARQFFSTIPDQVNRQLQVRLLLLEARSDFHDAIRSNNANEREKALEALTRAKSNLTSINLDVESKSLDLNEKDEFYLKNFSAVVAFALKEISENEFIDTISVYIDSCTYPRAQHLAIDTINLIIAAKFPVTNELRQMLMSIINAILTKNPKLDSNAHLKIPPVYEKNIRGSNNSLHRGTFYSLKRTQINGRAIKPNFRDFPYRLAEPIVIGNSYLPDKLSKLSKMIDDKKNRIVIQGPSGYGKTQLVAHYSQGWGGTKLWFDCGSLALFEYQVHKYLTDKKITYNTNKSFWMIFQESIDNQTVLLILDNINLEDSKLTQVIMGIVVSKCVVIFIPAEVDVDTKHKFIQSTNDKKMSILDLTPAHHPGFNQMARYFDDGFFKRFCALGLSTQTEIENNAIHDPLVFELAVSAFFYCSAAQRKITQRGSFTVCTQIVDYLSKTPTRNDAISGLVKKHILHDSFTDQERAVVQLLLLLDIKYLNRKIISDGISFVTQNKQRMDCDNEASLLINKLIRSSLLSESKYKDILNESIYTIHPLISKALSLVLSSADVKNNARILDIKKKPTLINFLMIHFKYRRNKMDTVTSAIQYFPHVHFYFSKIIDEDLSIVADSYPLFVCFIAFLLYHLRDPYGAKYFLDKINIDVKEYPVEQRIIIKANLAYAYFLSGDYHNALKLVKNVLSEPQIKLTVEKPIRRSSMSRSQQLLRVPETQVRLRNSVDIGFIEGIGLASFVEAMCYVYDYLNFENAHTKLREILNWSTESQIGSNEDVLVLRSEFLTARVCAAYYSQLSINPLVLLDAPSTGKFFEANILQPFRQINVEHNTQRIHTALQNKSYSTIIGYICEDLFYRPLGLIGFVDNEKTKELTANTGEYARYFKIRLIQARINILLALRSVNPFRTVLFDEGYKILNNLYDDDTEKGLLTSIYPDKTDPDCGIYFFLRALYHYEMKKYSEALDDAKAAWQIYQDVYGNTYYDNDRVECLELQSRILLYKGKFSEASEILFQIKTVMQGCYSKLPSHDLQIRIADVSIRYLSCFLFDGLGLSDIQILLKFDEIAAWIRSSKVKDSSDDIKRFEVSLRLYRFRYEDDDPAFINNLESFYQENLKFFENDYFKHLHFWFLLGDYYFKRVKNIPKALEFYDRALRTMDGKDAGRKILLAALLYRNIAACYLSTNKFSKALESLQNALAIQKREYFDHDILQQPKIADTMFYFARLLLNLYKQNPSRNELLQFSRLLLISVRLILNTCNQSYRERAVANLNYELEIEDFERNYKQDIRQTIIHNDTTEENFFICILELSKSFSSIDVAIEMNKITKAEKMLKRRDLQVRLQAIPFADNRSQKLTSVINDLTRYKDLPLAEFVLRAVSFTRKELETSLTQLLTDIHTNYEPGQYEDLAERVLKVTCNILGVTTVLFDSECYEFMLKDKTGIKTEDWLAIKENPDGTVSVDVDFVKGKQLHGWNTLDFLASRIFVFLQIYVDYKLGFIPSEIIPLNSKNGTSLFKTNELEQLLFEEIFLMIRAYFFRKVRDNLKAFDKDYTPPEIQVKDLFFSALCQLIGSLSDNEQLFIDTGYGIKGKPVHTFYITFINVPEIKSNSHQHLDRVASIVIRSDESDCLGKAYHKEPPPYTNDKGKVKIYPKIIGHVSQQSFRDEDPKVKAYLESVFRAPYQIQSLAAKRIYDSERRLLPLTVRDTSYSLFGAAKGAQVVPNCVVKNSKFGLMLRFFPSTPVISRDEQRQLYRWLRDEELARISKR
ncbi:MAG: tetratricopeptide repeat protein, partial [Gammaproteobacteria bacterium]